MTGLILASLACAAWVYLLAGRGGFWRMRERDVARSPVREEAQWPSVTAVIPARDEADAIGANLRSLLRQHYDGALSVVVVDDHSSDATIATVEAIAAEAPGRVTVLAAPPLPAGWTGKLSAIAHGIRHAVARPGPPEFLLLTDADITYDGDALAGLVARARDDGLVLSSLMAKLRCESVAERALIPAFIFFFRMLYPFAWVNRAECATAAAAGGCMLVNRRSLEAAGGIEAIRGELIDDCALARLLKRRGPIHLALSEDVRSTRAYGSFGALRRMIARCAYTQLRCQPASLAGTLFAMLVVFVVPPVLAVLGTGLARVLGLLAWGLMAIAFQPMLRFYRVSPAWGIAFPAIAVAYAAFTLDSALAHLRGRGGEWKGRVAGPGLRPASRSRSF